MGHPQPLHEGVEGLKKCNGIPLQPLLEGLGVAPFVNQFTANFITLIASEFDTVPPTLLVA